jgi:hypothetical protein
MKSGVIVYLVGGAELPEGLDLAGQCRALGLKADRVEFVGPPEGFFAVEDAWHHLFTKGYRDIQLLVAQAQEACLRPIHPLLRLNG